MAGEHQEGIRPLGCAVANLTALAPHLYRGEIIVVTDNDTNKDIIGLRVADSSPTTDADLFIIPIRKIQRNTSNTTIDGTSPTWFGNTDAGSFTYTLPAGKINTEYRIVNTGTSGNILTISPDGTEHLLGVNSSFSLNDGESLIVAYETTDGWY